MTAAGRAVEDPEPWDAVVVGSGFGGAVTAARLAQAGWHVVVLERGRPWPPGSFPRTPRRLAADGFWEPGAGRYGLFEVSAFSDVSTLVASGLGGGSLIYANVALRKPPETFDESWPVGAAELEPHYRAVEAVLAPQPFPVEHEPFASVPKTAALVAAARAAGLEAELPPLAVRFAPGDGRAPAPGEPLDEPRRTLHGRPRTTCRLVGECDLGCDAGAKQSLDHTYLTIAQRTGRAALRCLCEVTALRRNGDAWEVEYAQPLAARDGCDPALLDDVAAPVRRVRARHVVLAAGTLGTVRLLLGQRAALPGLSDQLGRRVSMNGDLIAFARDCREPGGEWRALDPSHGPVITASVRVPAAREHWVQDGGSPAFAEWLWHLQEVPEDLVRALPLAARRTWARLRGRGDPNLGDEIARGLGTARASASMLPLLGMGLDRAGGELRLDDGRLDLRWDEEASEAYFEALRQSMQRLARELGGELRELPGGRLTTVHPVGGAAMGRTAHEGVVDPFGCVHGFPGLHVHDGSVLPGAVGPNPSLTIAALADRFTERMVEAA